MRAPPGVDLNHFKVASTLHIKTPPPGYRDILAPISLDLTPIGLGEGGIKENPTRGQVWLVGEENSSLSWIFDQELWRGYQS